MLEIPMLIPSLSIIIVMIASLLVCICGCRKKIPRNELLGLAGIVKITNPDITAEVPPVGMSVLADSSKNNTPSLQHSPDVSVLRSSGTSNCGTAATRSLPDLPVEVIECINRTESAASGIDVTDGINIEELDATRHTSIDTGSELYATVEENKTREHYYSQVGNCSSNRNSSVVARNLSEQSELILITDGGTSEVNHAPVGDIAAASAISGVMAANSEIPYMTPPLQPNFFTANIQNSFKGYTSISVREPISQIMPTTDTMLHDNVDSHYITISDDSDEMYAAIADAYTSGSDTYAQICPVCTATTTQVISFSTSTQATSTTATNASSSQHSRTGSYASNASSSGIHENFNERREANSPLPKPPLDVADMYAKVIKKNKSTNNCVNHLPPVNDYNENSVLNSSSSVAGYETLVSLDETDCASVGYETIKQQTSSSDSNDGPGYECVSDCKINNSKSQTHYEQLSEPGYEEIH